VKGPVRHRGRADHLGLAPLHRDPRGRPRTPPWFAAASDRAGGILIGKAEPHRSSRWGGTLTHPFGQPRNPVGPERARDRRLLLGLGHRGGGPRLAGGPPLGEDTGGSVRTPGPRGAAAVGAASHLGPGAPLGPACRWRGRWDAPGPLTRSVGGDAALLLSRSSRGPDGHDRWVRAPRPAIRAPISSAARAGSSIGIITTLVDSAEDRCGGA